MTPPQWDGFSPAHRAQLNLDACPKEDTYAEQEALLSLDLDEEEDFGPGNPREYGDST